MAGNVWTRRQAVVLLDLITAPSGLTLQINSSTLPEMAGFNMNRRVYIAPT